MSLAAIIFDVDGTLAETEELHRAAFNQAFHRAGLDWHWDRALYARLLTTTGGKERLRRYRDETGQMFVDDKALVLLHRAKTEAYARLMAAGKLALRPGVAEVMAAARARGLKLALATTTTPANVAALTNAVWRKAPGAVFDAVAAGDEVAAKKPAPDIYLLALRRLGMTADQAIAIEDSRNGLRAAQAAGIPCIVTPSTYTGDEDFTGAMDVLPDLTGLALDRILA